MIIRTNVFFFKRSLHFKELFVCIFFASQIWAHALSIDKILEMVAGQCFASAVERSTVINGSGGPIISKVIVDHNGLTLANDFMEQQIKEIDSFSEQPLMEKGTMALGIKEAFIDLGFLAQMFEYQDEKQQIEKLQSYLQNAGIELTKITHGIHDDEPVYIIGANPREPTTPQLWINKKDFVPVREIKAEKNLTFDKWDILNPDGKKKFPSIIKIQTAEKWQVIALSQGEI